MIAQRANENILKLAVFALIALMALFEIVARRGLFADGAYFLVELLDKQEFFTQNDRTRLFMYLFTQFPTVLAIKLGVTNLTFLTYLFSSWLSLSPLLFWLLALGKLVRDTLFWPFLALFTIVYMNTNFFIIGEYNLSYALSACCFALMVGEKKNSSMDLWVLAGAATVLIMTYASTMFIGPLLAFLALRKMLKADLKTTKLYWLMLVIIFMAGAGVGLWGYLFPANLTNKSNAMDMSSFLRDKEAWITILCACIVFLQFSIPSRSGKDAAFLAILGVEVINAMGIFRPFPFIAFCIRAYMGFFLFACLLLIIVIRTDKAQHFLRKRNLGALPVLYYTVPLFILFAELALFDMQSSVVYGRYIDNFTRVVNTHEGFLEHGDSLGLAENDQRFGWTWTYTSMSLVLRDSADKAIVLNPPEGVSQQFFDPFKNLPDLSRYYGAKDS